MPGAALPGQILLECASACARVWGRASPLQSCTPLGASVNYLSWLLKAAIFFVVFAFALNNQGAVRLHLFFGAYWDAPLVLVVLAALVLGLVLGVAVMTPLWLRARRAARAAVAAPASNTESKAAGGGELPPHGI